jgi:hypothetical protein
MTRTKTYEIRVVHRGKDGEIKSDETVQVDRETQER